MTEFDIILTSRHSYSLAATGIKFKAKSYGSRESAKRDMYDFMDSHGLHIIDKYNDGHFKTYVCNDGVKFHINREM